MVTLRHHLKTKNLCLVISESARSEAVGMTRDVLLISVGIGQFSVLLSIHNVMSTFGGQGKCIE